MNRIDAAITINIPVALRRLDNEREKKKIKRELICLNYSIHWVFLSAGTFLFYGIEIKLKIISKIKYLFYGSSKYNETIVPFIKNDFSKLLAEH